MKCSAAFEVLNSPEVSFIKLDKDLNIDVTYRVRVTCAGECNGFAAPCTNQGPIDVDVPLTINLADIYEGDGKYGKSDRHLECYYTIKRCIRDSIKRREPEDCVATTSKNKECKDLQKELGAGTFKIKLKAFVDQQIADHVNKNHCICNKVSPPKRLALQMHIQNSLDDRAKRRLS
tara:strand:+ start:261 stop:788 length:528 start_codon:yes stop_codon:yes gene_type:complete